MLKQKFKKKKSKYSEILYFIRKIVLKYMRRDGATLLLLAESTTIFQYDQKLTLLVATASNSILLFSCIPSKGSCVGGPAGPEKGRLVTRPRVSLWIQGGGCSRNNRVVANGDNYQDGAAASIRFTLGAERSPMQQSKGKGGKVQRAVTPLRAVCRT